MSRKHAPRRAVAPMPPRGLRLPLSAAQQRDIRIALNVNLDTLARGQADVQVLWDVAECMFTWSRAAELAETGQEEMLPQLHLATRLIERFGATGAVRFEGCEYDVAREGVQVIAALASVVDMATAQAAAQWARGYLQQLRRRA